MIDKEEHRRREELDDQFDEVLELESDDVHFCRIVELGKRLSHASETYTTPDDDD